ncbi:MAG: hypothetical protein R3B47_01045 [Bacteroidia bacterium]
MQITPIVKNLLIINVLIWVSVLLLTYTGMPENVSGTVEYIYLKYFMLHKSNLLGIHGAGFPDYFNVFQLLGHFFSHNLGLNGHLFFNMLASSFYRAAD